MNELKMELKHSILTLTERGWSQRRIAQCGPIEFGEMRITGRMAAARAA